MRSTFAFTCLKFFFIIVCFAGFSCTKIHFTPVPTPPRGLPTPPNLVGQPNIILIVTDDVGYEVPSFNGGQTYSTPNLDRMAAQGVRFTNCFGLPLSSPSRFMIMTGRYNFRNYTTWGSMNPSDTTIASILRYAGYTTCVAGKWQFDGGDASIKALGYNNYCVWDAFKTGEEEEAELGSAYKDPTIYQNGGYLPPEQTAGKYGADIFNQYVMHFIDSNKSRPFFIYYPMPLAHAPFSPTPDNAAFNSWKSSGNLSDTMYYRSMVSYLDKEIDSVVEKVQADGIEKNTIIMVTSDNGTPSQIVSKFNGQPIIGGMGSTNIYGTHVPLLAYCPGSFPPGVSTSFVGFTDFLPTISDLAFTTLPNGFAIDGLSFRDEMIEPTSKGRKYLYSFYFPHPDFPNTIKREYVQDEMYKYYEYGYGFYNVTLDPAELNKITGASATAEEIKIAEEFRRIIGITHP